jgi:hypothetical protein
MWLKRKDVGTKHEDMPADNCAFQAALPNQLRNGLPGDASELRRLGLGNPVGRSELLLRTMG